MLTPQDFIEDLMLRAENKCELCSSMDGLIAIEVPSSNRALSSDTCALLCHICTQGIAEPSSVDTFHWNCIQGSIWSENPVIQVLSWRICTANNTQNWAQDLLSQIYFDDDTLFWAENNGSEPATLDANGVELKDGDSIYILKDLDVKGARFVAKRGTTVKNIRVTGDAEYIEGKVQGTSIMLKTCFIKKI